MRATLRGKVRLVKFVVFSLCVLDIVRERGYVLLMSNTKAAALTLPLTTAALTAYDAVDAETCELTDVDVAEWIERRKVADRAIWEAFAAETADRNNPADVLTMRMAVPTYAAMVRRLVALSA